MYLPCVAAIIEVSSHSPLNLVDPNRHMVAGVGSKQEVQWSNPIDVEIRKERTDNCADNGNIPDHPTREVL